MSDLRLATRRSPLALAQAESVRERLANHGFSSDLLLLETTGDLRSDVALRDVGGRGVFALEVQTAVLEGRADVAVHSAKDLPSTTPEGLIIGATPERADPADVLVGRSLAGLAAGATIATGSPRRRALLLERRPDLNIVELRGNMATRLDRAGHDGVDAIVAAAAALERLGWTARVAERLDPAWFTPQVGQGTIALEARCDDDSTLAALSLINNLGVMRTLLAERAFLRELGAGCAVPAGCFATLDGNDVRVAAVMAAYDGSVVLREQECGPNEEAVGARLAARLRDERGGDQLEGWSMP